MPNYIEDVVRKMVRGHVSLFRVWDDGIVHPLAAKSNQIQIGWGHIAAMTIGLGRKDYRLSGVYVEFENVADPDDVVTAPTYEATEGLEYYADLSLSATRDYLRIPLMQTPLVSIQAGDEDFFVAGESGNVLTCFAMTQGTAGVHGKEFSDAVNSKVCGVALVAIPNFQDASKDAIFARTYYEAADQVAKLPASQVGVRWDVKFIL